MTNFAPAKRASNRFRGWLTGVVVASAILFSQTAEAQDAPAGKAAVEKQDSKTDSGKPLGLDLPAGNATGPVDADAALKELGYKEPADIVREALGDPPNAKRLSQKSSLWVDTKNHRVFVDGYIALRDAPLEMFACPAGTKEHESIVGVLAKSNEVHAALLAIGAMPGTTVKFDPKYVPATGQRIRVWVMYRDPAGEFKSVDARSWVRKGEAGQSLEMDWVFAGSTTWTDPQDGVNYYQANSGEMICVSNFGTAMMDLPIESSDSTGALQFWAYTDRIPPNLTPVRLVLVPIPIPSDKPVDPTKSVALPDKAPDESLLPKKK